MSVASAEAARIEFVTVLSRAGSQSQSALNEKKVANSPTAFNNQVHVTENNS
jgi:hypothetical protein